MTVDSLELYSQLSELRHFQILPEVGGRVAHGVVARDALPLELFTFRVLWVPAQDGTASSLVQLNEEVQLHVMARAKRAFPAGEMLTLDDIHAEGCSVVPPVRNGKPCPNVLWQRLFLNSFLFFNNPQDGVAASEGEPEPAHDEFPLLVLANTMQICDVTKPSEKLEV